MPKNIFRVSLVFILSIFILACGSDEDTFVASAIVTSKAEPNTIDTGDRSRLTIDISEVHENGILLKVRFGKALAYVPSSSSLYMEGSQSKESITPFITTESSEFTYLVYFLSKSQFGAQNKGKIQFELKAIKAGNVVSVEVDPDVDDPDISNDVEFTVKEPNFSPDSISYITIRTF